MSNAYKLTWHDLRRLAKEREALHKYHKSGRQLSPASTHLIGLVGEWLFANKYDLDMDLSIRPGGDNGIDFTVRQGTIDVKTYLKPINLLREIDKPHADILVLAGIDLKKEDVWLIGWEFDEEMLRCPTNNFGHGVINHYKHNNRLKPMSALDLFLGITR